MHRTDPLGSQSEPCASRTLVLRRLIKHGPMIRRCSPTLSITGISLAPASPFLPWHRNYLIFPPRDHTAGLELVNFFPTRRPFLLARVLRSATMHSSYSVASVASAAVFTFLATIAVLLRQYAQSLKKQPMTIDAWLLLGGLVREYRTFIILFIDSSDHNSRSRRNDHLWSRRWWIGVVC
jgi:hypothetical protein